MSFGLNGKTVIVAASSSVIGRSVVLGLAREWSNITICAKDTGTLEKTRIETQLPVNSAIFAVPADTTVQNRFKM